MQTLRLSDEQRVAFDAIIEAVRQSRVKPWLPRAGQPDSYIFFVQAAAGCGALRRFYFRRFIGSLGFFGSFFIGNKVRFLFDFFG